MPFAPQDIVGAVEVWVADDIAQADASAVAAWAGRKSASSLAQGTGGKQPLYRTTGIGGQPAVDFDGTDDLLRYAGTLSTGLSGHVFTVALFDATGANEVLWASADEASTDNYILGQMNLVSTVPKLELQHRITSNNTVDGDSTLASATAYLIEHASSGTAWTERVNDVLQSLTVAAGSNNGDWFGDATGRDSFTAGALKRTTEGLFLNGKIGLIVVVDGAISSTDRQSLYDWVDAKYGIVLPDAAIEREREMPRGVHRGVTRGVT